MRKTTMIILCVLLSVAVAVSRCDRNKAERATLHKQVTDVEANLTRLNEQQAEVSKDLAILPSEIKQYAVDLQQHSQRLTKLQDDLGVYLLDHKMATVAIIALGGGAASIIDDNIDEETKDVLRVIGIVGALYCVANSEECADVTARVMYYGSQIEAENKTVSYTRSQLSAKQSSLREREKEHASLAGMITRKVSERDALKQKHDSLLCRLCF
jgi:septal ring factor EnvC (AmiA/AmiB activator)